MPKTIGIGIAVAIATVSVIGGYAFFSLQDAPDVLGVKRAGGTCSSGYARHSRSGLESGWVI